MEKVHVPWWFLKFSMKDKPLYAMHIFIIVTNEINTHYIPYAIFYATLFFVFVFLVNQT